MYLSFLQLFHIVLVPYFKTQMWLQKQVADKFILISNYMEIYHFFIVIRKHNLQLFSLTQKCFSSVAQP